MKFTVESLQDKIPASVYELLTTEDYMALPLPEEADMDVAHAVIAPPHVPNGWYTVRQRPLAKEQIEVVNSCTVAESEFGLSMKFELTNGEVRYIPCGVYPLFKVGQEWHPEDLQLIELEKYYEDHTIWRVEPITQHVDTFVFPMSKEEFKLREQTFGKILNRYYNLMKRDGKKINIFKYLRLY